MGGVTRQAIASYSYFYFFKKGGNMFTYTVASIIAERIEKKYEVVEGTGVIVHAPDGFVFVHNSKTLPLLTSLPPSEADKLLDDIVDVARASGEFTYTS